MKPVLIKIINMGDFDDRWRHIAQPMVDRWKLTPQYKKLQEYGLNADEIKLHKENSWRGDYNLRGCGIYCNNYDPKKLTLATIAGILPKPVDESIVMS